MREENAQGGMPRKPWICPRCDMVNEAVSSNCDCGYSRRFDDPEVESRIRKKSGNLRIWIGSVLLLVGVGLTCGSFFVYAKMPELGESGKFFYGLMISGGALLVSGLYREPDERSKRQTRIR